MSLCSVWMKNEIEKSLFFGDLEKPPPGPFEVPSPYFENPFPRDHLFGLYFLYWNDTTEDTLSSFFQWSSPPPKSLADSGCLGDGVQIRKKGICRMWRGHFTMFVHWKGTLEGTLSCFIYHGSIQEGIFTAFFSNNRGWGGVIVCVCVSLCAPECIKSSRHLHYCCHVQNITFIS